MLMALMNPDAKTQGYTRIHTMSSKAFQDSERFAKSSLDNRPNAADLAEPTRDFTLLKSVEHIFGEMMGDAHPFAIHLLQYHTVSILFYFWCETFVQK